MNTKDHDGIFKTAFREPKRAASLLKLAAKKNKSLARFLQVVDLKTMRAERTETNRQGLKGSADLAFSLKIKNSNNKAKLFVGLVLEQEPAQSKTLRQVPGVFPRHRLSLQNRDDQRRQGSGEYRLQ